MPRAAYRRLRCNMPGNDDVAARCLLPDAYLAVRIKESIA
jgi:hypothetical protein